MATSPFERNGNFCCSGCACPREGDLLSLKVRGGSLKGLGVGSSG